MPTERSILLLGKNGQLGSELQHTLAPLGRLTAIDYEEVDLADPIRLRQAVRDADPHIIVNAAAYTDVDRAESDREKAFAINAAAPGVLAEEARRSGSALLHISTDYVFDGQKGSPYIEADPPRPLNVYGASKLEGERAIQAVGDSYLILRTAWLYTRRGNNFVTKVLEWSRHKPVLRIVDDQVSNPTWAGFLSAAIGRIVGQAPDFARWLIERRGLYHLAGGGFTSRFDWARAILDLDPSPGEQVTRDLQPAATSEFPTPARRPLFSALDSSRFAEVFGVPIPDWRDSLRSALSGR